MDLEDWNRESTMTLLEEIANQGPLLIEAHVDSWSATLNRDALGYDPIYEVGDNLHDVLAMTCHRAMIEH